MTTAKNPSTITADVISDVVCPWCYIGKRRLDAAIAELSALAAQVSALPTAVP